MNNPKFSYSNWKEMWGNPQIHVNNIYIISVFIDMDTLQSYKDDFIINLIDLTSYEFWKKAWK